MKKKINIYNFKSKKLNIENPKKISVIIPNYNYADYIIKRIDSILFQTYPIFELIILDDFSTDNSIEVIENKINQIKRNESTKDLSISFYKNEKNSGSPFEQWKKGFELAKGDYIWIAEADDACTPNLLEKLIIPFEKDDNMVISYCDSARIDENDYLIRENSEDLYDMCRTGEWRGGYSWSGNEEIIYHLSVTNTILNASSVLWKKGNYSDIFEQAKNFKVAGDWYVYYKILENGNISFCPESLNFYRKHSNSASTVVKAKIEYGEICKIQDDISNKYNLPNEVKEKQQLRRTLMMPQLQMEEIQNQDDGKKKIAWVMPHPGKGSGGHRTIIQNINALMEKGYSCDIYVEEDGMSTRELVSKKINDYYGNCNVEVYVGFDLKKEYDIVFATGYTTTEFVNYAKAKDKAYFIQDFEPWFFAMGDQYLITENSYRYGFKCVTIGKWLAHKMATEYNNPVGYFDFCADLNNYKKLDNIKKENAICFTYQPEKPRRCDYIGLKALKIVKELKPDVQIYLFGSNFPASFDFECKNLKIIPIEKCNELYNKCKVGICMSASNPSRIPFEMMASGLPVVELYRENNLYDMPDGGVILAEPTPGAIASAIITILEDEKLQKNMSEFGLNYMKDFPIERGYEQFLEKVDKIINNDYNEIPKIEKLYNKDAFKTIEKVKQVAYEVTKPHIRIDNISNTKKFFRRIKRLPSLVKSRLKKYLNKFRARR